MAFYKIAGHQTAGEAAPSCFKIRVGAKKRTLLMIFDLICFKLPSPDFKTDLFKRSFTYAIQCVMTILIFLLSQIEAVVDFLTLYF